MQSILVATDFSDASLNAARYAAVLSRKTGAGLTLLHVFMLPTPVGEMPYVMVSAEEIQAEHEKQIAKLAADLEPIAGKKINTLVNIGMPADEIVYQTEELKTDLVVSGMQGTNSALDKFIGSTTVAIIRKSKVPVLVIPAGHSYESIHSITFATDFNDVMNEKSFHLLQDWLSANPDVLLQIVHIQQPGEDLSDSQANSKSGLQQRLQQVKHLFFHEKHDSVEDGLDQFLSTHPSQLLVMITHRHSWWHRLLNSSHTTEMAYRAEGPLLVLQNK